jgi:hypothetical protein
MRYAVKILLCLALLSGCRAQGVRGYWDQFPLLEDDIRLSEDRFADFAELAVKAPEADAIAAIDVLFDRLKKDSVAYYVYSDWIDAAFYSLYSPCRNATLYNKAVERIVTDAVLQTDECEPFLKRREWIGYNRLGDKAVVPGRSSITERTLVLVLDLSCPSCRQVLDILASDPEWADVHRLAVCFGHGSLPSGSGWEFLSDNNAAAVFDPQLTPIYFVVAADGTVEKGYTLAL